MAKKPAKKSGKSKKAGTAKKSATKKASGGAFEGSLLYRLAELHDWKTRALSFGGAFNGDRTMQITVKGNRVHIADLSLHQHHIFDGTKWYLYSDITNEGHILTAEQHKELQGERDFSDHNRETGFTPTNTMAIRPEETVYKGDKLKIYSGSICKIQENRTDIELWYSTRYSLPDNAMFYTFMKSPGLVKKGIVHHLTSAGVIGKLNSFFGIELVGVNPHAVKISEVTPPADINFSKLDKIGDLVGFNRRNTKALKKLKIYPEGRKAKELKKELRQEWDFVEDWEKERLDVPGQMTAWQFGQKIIDGVGTVISAAQGKRQAQSLPEISRVTEIESKKSDRETKPDGDSYYIPDLIARLESERAPYKEVHEKLSAKQKKDLDHNTKQIKKAKKRKWGEQPATSGDMPNLRSMDYRPEDLAAADVDNEWQDVIKQLKAYSLKKKTDYISKKDYERIRKNARKLTELKHKQQGDLQDLHHDENSRRIYHNYASRLEDFNLGRYDYTIGEVRDIQKTMKRLRTGMKKGSITKSKWEDWDGIPTK